MTTGLNHGYGGVKVNKKLNVKVPKSKLALYKKILQSRGLSGKAKITKQKLGKEKAVQSQNQGWTAFSLRRLIPVQKHRYITDNTCPSVQSIHRGYHVR